MGLRLAPDLNVDNDAVTRKFAFIGARDMLKAIASLDPRPVTREQVAALAGLVSTSGTFSAYLSDLRKRGLMDDAGRRKIRASNSLFPGAS